MRLLNNIILPALASIIIHTVVQVVIFNMMGFKPVQDISNWSVVSAVCIVIIFTYLFLRHKNNKSRPDFATSLVTVFLVQVITIISLIAINIATVFIAATSQPGVAFIPITFDAVDYVMQVLILIVAPPLIILPILYLLDRQKTAN